MVVMTKTGMVRVFVLLSRGLFGRCLSATAGVRGSWVRYHYEGAKPSRDSRLLRIDNDAGNNAGDDVGEGEGASPGPVRGARVLELLRDAHVELDRWEPHTYCPSLEGWRPLDERDTFHLDGLDERETPARRIDVQLFATRPASVDGTAAENRTSGSTVRSDGAAAAREALPEGYFLCGVYGAKSVHNLGTLWRSAYQLGAAGLFVVGSRLDKHLDKGDASEAPQLSDSEESFQSFRSPAAEDVARLALSSSSSSSSPSSSSDMATTPTPTLQNGWAHRQPSDTTRAWRRVPFVQHAGWNAFSESLPFGSVLVGVEMGGEPLHSFEHPLRAVYVLGSEDNGLPDAVLRACHRHVALPTASARAYESFNVAAAGSILMYDRRAKQLRRKDDACAIGNEGTGPKSERTEKDTRAAAAAAAAAASEGGNAAQPREHGDSLAG